MSVEGGERGEQRGDGSKIASKARFSSIDSHVRGREAEGGRGEGLQGRGHSGELGGNDGQAG